MENPLTRWIEPVARVAAIACGYGVLVLAAAVCVEIIGRKLFGFSLQGVDDIGGYVLAVTAAIGASYAMAMRAHTRIDVLLVRLSPALQALLNAVAMITLAGFAIYASWRGWDVLGESIEFRSVATNPLQTPLWQPQALWVAGLSLFAIFATAYALHALWLLAADPRKLNRFYGPASAQEEVDAEVAARQAREAGTAP